MPASPPRFGPIATVARSHGIPIPGYSDQLVATDDSVLRERGGHLGIYTELLRDDQVASTFQQRRLAVTSTEWSVEAASESRADREAGDFVREQLTGLAWDAITDKMLYAVFYGYAIAECLWAREANRVVIDDILVREQARFRISQRGALYLGVDDNTRWQRMPEGKFWRVATGAQTSDQPYGRGLGHHLYWPVYFKRHGVRFWMSYLDKYGAPTAIGKAPAGLIDDSRFRRQLLDALEAIHSDSAVVLPEEAEIALMDAFRAGAAVDFDRLRATMDSAISKVVLSQTMTTDDGSSRSQSETHKEVRDEVIKADADLICESFNAQVASWLTAWNFPNATPPRVWRDTEPPDDLNERAERDQKVYALGFEPTEAYVRETYGEGWVKRQAGVMRLGEPGDDAGAQFAELAALTGEKNANRADQQALVAAAREFANRYHTIMGERVAGLLSYLDDSRDLDTFRKQLNVIMAEAPPREAVASLERGGLVARLLGLLRGQR